MPLKNKYLKYSPEITLEIFKLVWNKLSETYKPHSNGAESEYICFRKSHPFLRLVDNGSRFGVYIFNSDLSETTVQEILGYDPFVKPDFVLPEKWCIKEDNEIVTNWLNKNKQSGSSYSSVLTQLVHYPAINGCHLFARVKEGYTEITLDQFKQYVLKEPIKIDWLAVNNEDLLEEARRRYPKGTIFKSTLNKAPNDSTVTTLFINMKTSHGRAVHNDSGGWVYSDKAGWAEIISLPEPKTDSKIESIPEYVECVESSAYMIFGRVYKCAPVMSGPHYSLTCNLTCGDYKPGAKLYCKPSRVKPSTKEAYDAQATKEPVKKWNIGSYVVFLNDNVQSNGFKKGSVQKIVHASETLISFKSMTENTISDKRIADQIKWFATLPEAEEFAKTLLSPATSDLMKVVYCTTQEEWDYVSEKINYKFTSKFQLGQNDTINSNTLCFGSKAFYEKDKTYQVLSFKEWCKSKGYKPKSEAKLPFKVGEPFVLKSKPSLWSGRAGGDCGLYAAEFPYTSKVVNIIDRGDHIAIFDGTYGWCYDSELFSKIQPTKVKSIEPDKSPIIPESPKSTIIISSKTPSLMKSSKIPQIKNTFNS